MTRILIVDDNPYIRKGMRSLLELEPTFEVCHEADSAEDALKVLSRLQIDVALIDISLGSGGDEGGIQLIRDIRAKDYKFPILTISLHEEVLYAERILQAGAQGYLMKQEAPSQLVKAIRQLCESGVFLNTSV